jgi:intein-encoded DNA endonuclease-like protein
MSKLGDTPGSWRVRHDRVPPELAKALYSEAQKLASRGFGPVNVARQLSAAHSLSLSPGTLRHWIVGDREPVVRNVFKAAPSPALSYIIGANKGDGCTLAKSGLVKLEVTDKDFAHAFNASMATLFSRSKPNKILVRRRVGRLPMYIVKYFSRQLVQLLRQPLQNLLKLASVFPQDFLRGFFDAEGFVEVAAQDIFDLRVGVENTNRTLLSGAKHMLDTSFGINSTLRRKRRAGTLKTIRGESFLTRRASFRLLIGRLGDIRNFEQRIGFAISRKQRKLKDALGILQRISGERKRSFEWREEYSKEGGEWAKI